MSTKIDHGFKLKPGIDPFNFITRVREHMDPARDKADARLLAELYATDIDSAWFSGNPIAAAAGYKSWRNWHLEQSKMSPMQRSHDPNEFGVQIGKDPLTGGYYLLAIAYNHELRDAFEEMDEIAEYGYWNNTDSYPDGVTREDWEVREALWNRVIPRIGPSNIMTFNLRRPSDGGIKRMVDDNSELVFEQMPSNRERAKAIVLGAYAGYLSQKLGMDIMDAANHVFFGRATNLEPLIDIAEAHLLPITPELVTEGTGGRTINSGYQEEIETASKALAELDTDKLRLPAG